MSRDLREALRQQMEAQSDDMTPSSIQRDKGLVWLEGWFDLDAALSAARPVIERETREAFGSYIDAWFSAPSKTLRVEFATHEEAEAAFNYIEAIRSQP